MTYKFFAYAFTLALIFSGCGGTGSSGVDSSKHLNDLTSDELSTLCDWMLDKQGGAGVETDCGDGLSTTNPTKAECTAETNVPNCQVSAVESCMEAIDGNSCNLLSAEGCATYIACAFSSAGS